ncbi:glycosyltransferase [Roseobacter sp. HKCCD5988]|uniref:glycosyltransferase n=1 Tax=Roseobacter sp. HKCCD5988 TaxID=3120338 RepID=UPI0030EB7DA1
MAIANPRVSWIICIHTLDHSGGIDAIQSCLDQTFVDQEVIVICNGSKSDLLREKVDTHFGSDDRLKIISSPIKGLGGNLAYGVILAQGEFIARIDSDDTCPDDRIAKQVELLEFDKSAHLVSSSRGQIQNIKIVQLNNLALRNIITHPSVLVRKSSILLAGNYSSVFGAEDYELWVRILGQQGGHFLLTNEKFVNYGEQGVSGFRKNYRAYVSVLQVQVKVFFENFRFIWGLGVVCSLVRLIYLKIHGRIGLKKT